MPPFQPRFSSSRSDSWFTRVCENLQQLLTSGGLSPTSANGAPIHLLRFRRTRSATRAQTISFTVHAAVFAAIALLAAHQAGKGNGPLPPTAKLPRVFNLPPRLLAALGAHPSDGGGHGGDHNPMPAKRGSLPPLSSIQLVRPSLPQNQTPELPVPPTLLDANAPPVLISIDRVGLPWMPEDTNSPGPGKGHGIGSADGDTMGDSGNGPAGDGNSTDLYRAGLILPSCVYCPLPAYTDEARHVKLQGTVTLRVLVGPDGKASNIRIVRGVGFGLDERAMETVRGWKFSPARDAGHRAVPAWIIVEAVFRLF